LTALLLGAYAPGTDAQAPQKQTFTYKQVGNLSIQADVHRLPAGLVKPVIFWIHGGALIFGDRERINSEQLRRYLEAGYILVSIDYRLARSSALIRTKNPAGFTPTALYKTCPGIIPRHCCCTATRTPMFRLSSRS